jgi:hypothetical protein
MRWSDKFGNVCEGTVAEYEEMMCIESKVERVESPKHIKGYEKVFDDVVGKSRKKFSKAERHIIKDNPALSVKELHGLLPNRSLKSIYNWRKILVKKKFFRRKSLPSSQQQIPKFQGSVIGYYNRFSDVEKQIIRDNPNKSVKELRVLLPNRSRPTIHKYRKLLLAKNSDKPFVPHRKSVRWTKELDDRLVQLKNDGMTIKAIRKELRGITGHKVSPSVVSSRLNILNKKGIKVVFGAGSQDRGRMAFFVKSRSKYLMNTYGYDYERARSVARDEWRVRQGVDGVKIQQPSKAVLFELVKITDDGERKVVNVYTSRADADAMRQECILASDVIRERAIYLIVQK